MGEWLAGAVVFVGVLLSGTMLHISGALEFEVESKGRLFRKDDAIIKKMDGAVKKMDGAVHLFNECREVSRVSTEWATRW